MFKTKRQLKKELGSLGIELSRMINELDSTKKEKENLKKQLSGERVCTKYCKECEHGISVDSSFSMMCSSMMYSSQQYICDLECKCKDFMRKDR